MGTRSIVAYSLFSSVMAFLVLVPLPTSAADIIIGNSLVGEGGSLKVKGRIIHLYGIYIPSTSTTCRSLVRSKRCASRVASALDLKIRGFVHCEGIKSNPDGSISALCHANYTSVSMGEDLAAYLLEQGWAVALPDAPFEYQALERIARHKGVGIWGFSGITIQ
jgi:endonuclease YncB( thermonuclease family)